MYLIRKRALGDVLWIEPVIRELAALHRKVVVYTKYPELFENYPLTNVRFKKELNIWEKLAWKLADLLHLDNFFINLDGAYEKNPRIHFLNAYQQYAKVPVKAEYPRLYLTESEKAFRPMAQPYVILHLESLTERNYRKVYGVDWSRIVRRLQDLGFNVIQLGKAPPAIEGTTTLNTTIRQMISVIRNAAFLIGIDSGPSHIAASLGTPALIFFGAVDPATRHFKQLFNGFFLQQYCEFAGCFHDVIIPPEPTCRLVGPDGIPKCSLHTTEYVLNNIDLLVEQMS